MGTRDMKSIMTTWYAKDHLQVEQSIACDPAFREEENQVLNLFPQVEDQVFDGFGGRRRGTGFSDRIPDAGFEKIWL